MKDHLTAYLKKVGIMSYDQMSPEEKETYREWEIALQGRKLTDEDVRRFLESELSTAVNRVTEVDLKTEEAIFRKVEVRFIKRIINFLNMPAMEQELLKKQIESKI